MWHQYTVDGFQMSIMHPTSWGQTCDQKELYCTYLSPWKKQLLSSFSTNGKDSMWGFCILHTAALNTSPDSCPLEMKPRPIKTIYSMQLKYTIVCGPLAIACIVNSDLHCRRIKLVCKKAERERKRKKKSCPPDMGLEPTTLRLKVWCSTTELTGLLHQWQHNLAYLRSVKQECFCSN